VRRQPNLREGVDGKESTVDSQESRQACTEGIDAVLVPSARRIRAIRSTDREPQATVRSTLSLSVVSVLVLPVGVFDLPVGVFDLPVGVLCPCEQCPWPDIDTSNVD